MLSTYIKHITTFLIPVILVSCGSKTQEQETATAAESHSITLSDVQIKNAGLSYIKPDIKAISSILSVNGKIEAPPQNLVSVSVPLGGFLKQTKLMPGSHVKKGELIAVMEDQQYIELQHNYLVSKERLAFLEKEYDRQKELNREKASSDKVFQQTEADYKSESVNKKSLEEKLKLLGIDPSRLNEKSLSRTINILSPIDGFVTEVHGNIGKYFDPTEVLFELVNPEDIHLSLTVFEKDLSKVFIGQRVTAKTNHQPDKKYTAEVILIGMNLSDERSVEVHCHFDEYDKSLIPGMYMNAEMEIKAGNAVVLPEESVVDFEGQKFIFERTANDKFEMKQVQTGITDHGFIEITSTIDTTRQIVSKGAYTLLMAMKNKEE